MDSMSFKVKEIVRFSCSIPFVLEFGHRFLVYSGYGWPGPKLIIQQIERELTSGGPENRNELTVGNSSSGLNVSCCNLLQDLSPAASQCCFIDHDWKITHLALYCQRFGISSMFIVKCVTTTVLLHPQNASLCNHRTIWSHNDAF